MISNCFKSLARSICKTNEWVGKAVSYLLVLMIIIVLYEVVLRSMFHLGTDWSFPISTFLLAGYSLLAGGYVHLQGGHINVDLVYGRLSRRTKAIVSLSHSVFILFFCSLIVWKGGDYALSSLMMGERVWGIFAPPIWPIRALIPIGAALIGFQDLTRFVSNLSYILTGRELI